MRRHRSDLCRREARLCPRRRRRQRSNQWFPDLLSLREPARRFLGPATAFAAPKTLYSLAAPYNGFQGFTIVGNGAGAYVAGWTLQTGVSSQTQALASYSSDGTTWDGARAGGDGALGPRGGRGVRRLGNALATYTGGAQPQSVYRSYLDDGWRCWTPARPGRRRERHRLRPARQRRAGRNIRHQRGVGVHGPERRQRRLQPLAGARDERERRRGRVARG